MTVIFMAFNRCSFYRATEKSALASHMTPLRSADGKACNLEHDLLGKKCYYYIFFFFLACPSIILYVLTVVIKMRGVNDRLLFSVTPMFLAFCVDKMVQN